MVKPQQLYYFMRHKLLQSFSPVYFAVNMGTSSINILLHIVPYGQDQRVEVLNLLIFLFNLSLFIVFTVWGSIHSLRHPQDWKALMKDPTSSLYWGCFPMGFSTLLGVAVNVLHGHFSWRGESFIYSLWIIWWINVTLSCACFWGMVHYMITSQTHTLQRMTPAWLLPVVTLIVASSTGGTLANALQEHCASCAVTTVAVDVFLVTAGFTMSFIIFTIYFQRLFIHSLPTDVAVLTVFLPLGPTGQAGYSITLIGQNLEGLLRTVHPLPWFLAWPYAGQVLYMLCICMAFLLWTLSTFFLVFSLLAMVSMLRKKTNIVFSPKIWGLVFPNGLYAILSFVLGEALDSSFFRVYGTVYAAATFLLWLSIMRCSLVHMYGAVSRSTPQAILLL